MSTNAENDAGSSLDWLKWLVVGALLVAGVFGNWYYQGEFLSGSSCWLVSRCGASGLYRRADTARYAHLEPHERGSS